MEKARRIIWTNEIDIEDWRDDIMNWHEEDEITEDELYNIAYDTNMMYLDDERANLCKELGNSLVVIGDIGRWNGRAHGWKLLKGTNLNEIFSETVGDYVTWYVEGEEIKCDDIHHDGTNHYTYRVIKNGISDWEFEEMMYEGKDINEMTEPLGHYVREIYGW